ncbi:MAG: hypothetical protein COA58_03800 [Bacteroidetes bacterium]|nr:MAG: hypothetical protein COA58_03800 [Bacteroidota bacterium]
MVVVNNVEQYLRRELAVTFEIVMDFVRGKKRSELGWNQQMKKLKKAFDLFMLDLDVNDFKSQKVFKDLKLPSERKTRASSEKRTKVKTGSKGRVVKTGKQFALFFIKASKKGLLKLVVVIESLSQIGDRWFKSTPDFENRPRSNRR